MRKFRRGHTNLKQIIGIIMATIGFAIVVSVLPVKFFLSILGFVMIVIGIVLVK